MLLGLRKIIYRPKLVVYLVQEGISWNGLVGKDGTVY